MKPLLRSLPALRVAGTSWLLLLALITLAGAAIRVDAASSPSRYQSADERAYAGLARGIAERGMYAHTNMADPVHWPPGAPMMFAAAHAIAPGAPDVSASDVPAAYVAQAAVATALIPLVALLAVLAGAPWAALAAAAATAFYPPLARSPGDLLSEPLGALLLTVSAIALVVALRRRSTGWLAAAGCVIGCTILTRADLIALPLLAAAVIALLGAGGPTERVRDVALVLGACALIVLPWTVFASSVAGRIVPVSSGGASNLYIGTYLPGDGTLFGLKRELGDGLRQRLPVLRDVRDANLPQERVLDVVVARRPGLEREAALRAEGVANLRRYAAGRPLAFAGMAARKTGRLWLNYTVGGHRNRRAAITSLHLTLLAASAAGLAVGLARRREPLLVLAALLVVSVTAVNAVFVSEARHALTVLPILFAAGAAGWART